MNHILGLRTEVSFEINGCTILDSASKEDLTDTSDL